MSPLVLLVLLAFFFVVALAFTVWAALNVGTAARRAEAAAEYAPAPARSRARREAEPRERKPWEREPQPAAPKERRQRNSRKDDDRRAPADLPNGSANRNPVVQGTLWEKRPEPAPAPKNGIGTRGQTTTGLRTEPLKPQPSSGNRRSGDASSNDARPAGNGKAVVTPRKPNSDAFERFLEAEKRRD